MIHKTYNTLFIILVALLTLTGCSSHYKYKIGVSQCVGGRWREKANNEMLAAQHLYDNDVKVIIKNADNSNERQCLQIDSLVDEGVDLLVVSPNDYHALDCSLQRARKKNIPIVFFDRITAMKDYAAYIGGDNVEAGRMMGEYAAMLCRDSVVTDGRRPVVLEMTGPLEISPATQRHAGFSNAVSQNPDIDYRHVPSQWSYDDCKRIMRQWIKDGKDVDIVFCHSDLAAIGAYDAAKELHKERDIRFLGIDGLPGEGIDAVQQGRLSASYIYPAHGEEVIALALRILEGKPYERINNMRSIVITPQNVADVSLTTHSLMKQNQYLATIQSKLEAYLGFYQTQRNLLVVSLLVILLLVVAVITIWRAVRAVRRANRRMREMNDEQTRFFTNASHQLRTPLTLIVVSDVMMPVMDGLTFCTRLKQHEATSHIPVLLLTARSSEQQHIEGLQTGADMYMTKPFCTDLLLANIASLLANRQKLRRLFKAEKEADKPVVEDKAPSPDRHFLDTFLKAMDKHMGNTNLKIEDLGDEMGLSRVQLYRKVKALTGMTPVEILRETRLKRAMQLLKTTDKTVSEIANEVGFATPGYFSSCFKKQYDKYPTDVREELRV